MTDVTDLHPMHTDFARWYGAVEFHTDQSRRQARWKGVVTVVENADRDDVEALIRLAFRARTPAAPAAVQKIRQAFKSVDDAFDMQGNDRELEVLAGVCLVALTDNSENVDAAAALSITTAALGGARKPNLPMDLCALAESAIDRIAEACRQRPTLQDDSPSEPLDLDFKKAGNKVRQTQDWDSIAAAFTLAAGDVRTAMEAAAERQASASQAVNQFVRIQDEELQMLWWLVGQRSGDYDCPFSDVPGPAQPLVFAKELADSTEFLPGPPSVKALLSRAGLAEREIATIPAAINASHPNWLAHVVGEDDPSPVSSPLHFAVKRQLETGVGDTWVPGWAAATGVSAEHAVSPLWLGVLFYRERLLQDFE